jgi:Protein kinase domain
MISSDHYCHSCGAANTVEAEACFACGVSLKITTPLELGGSAHSMGRPLLKQRYRILEQVGKGGFSVVYKAEDTQDNNREVAIKAITLHGLNSQEIIEATEAFNREMLLLSELKHRNLPRIRHHFSDTNCWYLVMDFIEGTALEKHLEHIEHVKHLPGGCLPLEEVLDIGILLCDVLAYLHGRQPPIIFRDLKPANVMLTVDGHLALIDFGIARRFKPGQQKDTMIFGSPGYAAPEQYGKAQTTPRADIYSLGVLLHQLLTGDDPSQNPFHFAPIETKGEDARVRLEIMITRMVEMDEGDRPQSITLVEQELRSIADAYRQQRLKGLQATNAPLYIPLVASWQTTNLPFMNGGSATPASGQTQIVMMQQQQQQKASGIHNPYAYTNASAGGATTAVPRRSQGMAIASMLLGFLTIIMPIFICTLGSNIPYGYGYGEIDYRMLYLVLSLLLFGPALLAIIFGHIALYNAQNKYWMQSSVGMAKTGLAIGYVFGSIYGIFLCYVLSSFWSR